MMDLIPGLPNDIVLQCLFRLSFSQIHSLRSVCKAWKSEIKLSELLGLRKSAGKAKPLIILSEVNQNSVPRLLVFDPETGFSSDMPPLPESNKLPFDCRIAIVGSELVVMGGYYYQTERCLDSVFIFDFFSSKWRRGANIPDGPRTDFACATYGNRTVFIAGGHNWKKKTFTSAWTYDIATNNWNKLPDMVKDPEMAEKAYECEGLFYHDKFVVVILMQGWESKVQKFDISAKQWSDTDDPFLDWQFLSCVEGSDQNLYKNNGDDLVVLEDDMWKSVATLPTNMYELAYLIASPGHFWLLCASNYRQPYDSFKIDLKDRNWIMGKAPIKFSGPIDSGYSLII